MGGNAIYQYVNGSWV